MLSLKAIGVVELHGGMHGQANGTERGAIAQALKRRFGGLPERNSRDARVTLSGIVDIPRIIGSVSGQVSGVLIEGSNGLTIQGEEIHDIIFVKRPGIFNQDDIAIVRGGGSGDTGAIVPEEFFLLFFSRIANFP